MFNFLNLRLQQIMGTNEPFGGISLVTVGDLFQLKDPVLPIEHCTLRSLGSHFCDVENSEAFVYGENRTH